jgi:hypothetical protein
LAPLERIGPVPPVDEVSPAVGLIVTLCVYVTVAGAVVEGRAPVSVLCQRICTLFAKIANPGAMVGGNSVVIVVVGLTDSAVMLRSVSG